MLAKLLLLAVAVRGCAQQACWSVRKGPGDVSLIQHKSAVKKTLEADALQRVPAACASHVPNLRERAHGHQVGLESLLQLIGRGIDDLDSERQARPEEHHCLAAASSNGLLQTSPKRLPVLWLHLHTFAGTFICEEAIKQGEVTPTSLNPASNCNWPGEECSQWNGTQSCQAKSSHGAFTFSMLERHLQPSDLCAASLQGTMLREPMAALRSVLAANHYRKEDILEILKTQNMTLRALHDGCLPNWDTYHHFDNFATRSLSGAYMLPPGRVNETHLEIAKKHLQQMNVVLILEELGDHLTQLSSTFGWDVSSVPTSKEVNRHFDDGAQTFSAAEESFLSQYNKFDYELYEFGKALAAKRTAAAIEAHHQA